MIHLTFKYFHSPKHMYPNNNPSTNTGTEALFADVGHFSVRSIQLSMSAVTYPALIFAYIGQASFLRKHDDLVSDTFYKSIPGMKKQNFDPV